MSTFENNVRTIGTIAISRIKVYEAKHTTVDLAQSLQTIAGSLKDRPGCLAYDVAPSADEKGLWIVTGRWNSFEAMEDHFEDPALNTFSALMQNHVVSRLDFSSNSF